MVATTSLGIRYRVSTDPPAIHTTSAELAEDVNGLIVADRASIAAINNIQCPKDRVAGSTATSLTTYAGLVNGTTVVGAAMCGITMVVPPSGSIEVVNGGAQFNSGTGFVYCSFRIRSGGVLDSGTILYGATDAEMDTWAWTTQLVTATIQGTYVEQVDGLTPGATINIRQMIRTQNNTGNFYNKVLRAKGLL